MRDGISRQDWPTVLELLVELGDAQPASPRFWELLAEAARQMMLERSHRRCRWRGLEARHGTLWVESAERLGPGETADARLLPLRPERWRRLTAGDVITMHRARPVVGSATVVEVLPARP